MISREDFIRQFRSSNPDHADWSDDAILDGYIERLGAEVKDYPALVEHVQRKSGLSPHVVPMLAAFRQARPDLAGDSDADLLWKAAKHYEEQGVIDQLPALHAELERQRGLFEARGRGFVGDMVSAGKRGAAAARQSWNVMQGLEDPTNAKDFAEAELKKQRNAPSEELRGFMGAEGFWESAKAFAANPIDITAEVIVESLPNMVPGIIGSAVGAVGGAKAGTIGGLPGVAVGAALGAGAGSFAVETASKMIDVMQEKGMNPADPESVAAFFTNPQLMEEAKAEGAKRGLAVGLFDALSAGLAGRFLKPLQVAAKAGQTVTEGQIIGRTAADIALTQALPGAAGEVAGQLATGEEIQPKAAFLEAVAEIGSAPVEIRNNLGELRIRPKAPPAEFSTETETPAAPAMASYNVDVEDVKPFFTGAVPPAGLTPEQASAFGAALAQKILSQGVGVPLTEEETAFLAVPENRAMMAAAVEAVERAEQAEQENAARLASIRSAREVGDQMAFGDPSMTEAMRTRRSDLVVPPAEVTDRLNPENPGEPYVSRETEGQQTVEQEIERQQRLSAEQAAAIARRIREEEAARRSYLGFEPGEQTLFPGSVRGALRRVGESPGRLVEVPPQGERPDPTFPTVTQTEFPGMTEPTPVPASVAAPSQSLPPEAMAAAVRRVPVGQQSKFPGSIMGASRKISEVDEVEGPVQGEVPSGNVPVPVQTEMSLPTEPPAKKALPVLSPTAIAKVLPETKAVAEIRERLDKKLGAVLISRSTGEVFVVPVDIKTHTVTTPEGPNTTRTPEVVFAAPKFESQVDIARALSEKLRTEWNMMKGTSLPTMKNFVQDFINKDTGAVLYDQIDKAYRSPTKNKLYRFYGKQAEELLTPDWKGRRMPIADLRKTQSGTDGFILDRFVTLNEPMSGTYALGGTLQELHARTEEDKKAEVETKRQAPQELTDRQLARLAADQYGLPKSVIPRVEEAIGKLRRKKPAALGLLKAGLTPEGTALTNEDVTKVQRIIREISGKQKGDTPEFVTKVAQAALAAVSDPAIRTKKADAPAGVAAAATTPPPVTPPAPVPPAAAPVAPPPAPTPAAVAPEPAATPPAKPKKMRASAPKGPRSLQAFLEGVSFDVATAQKVFNALNPTDGEFLSSSEAGLSATLNRLEEAFAPEKFAPDFRADLKRVENFVKVLDERLTDWASAQPGPGEKVQRRVQPARQGLRHFDAADKYRAAPDDTLLDRVVYAMMTRGVRVSIQEVRKDLAAGGYWTPSNRTVALVLDSVENPSKQSVLNALHEIAHVIVEDAPDDVRREFHDLIERLPNSSLAFYKNPEADPRLATGKGLTPEQLTIERGVEHLALTGLKHEYARGLLQAFWRAVKEAYYRVALAITKQFGGEENVTGGLAKRWMENEVAKVLAGDAKVWASFFSYLGRKQQFTDSFRLMHDEADQAHVVKLDVSTGRMEFTPIPTLDGAIANIDAAFIGTKRSAMNSGTWGLDESVAYLESMLGPDVMQREPQSMSQVPLVKDAEGRLLAPNGKPSKLNERLWRLVRTPEFKNWFGDWQNDPANASKVVDENGEPMVVYHGTRNQFSSFDRDAAPEETRDLAAFMSVMSPLGSHFATSPEIASRFAEGVYDTIAEKGTPNVHAVFLNIRNIADVGPETEFLDTLYSEKVSTSTVDMMLDEESAPEETLVAMPGEEIDTANERVARYERDPRFRRNIHRAALVEESRYDDPSTETADALVEAWKTSNPTVDGVLYQNEAPREIRGVSDVRAYVAFRPEQIKSVFNIGTFFPNEADTMRRVQPGREQEFARWNGSQAVVAARSKAEAAIAVANTVHPIVERMFAKYKAVEPQLTKAQRAALKRDGRPAPGAIDTIEAFYRLLGMRDPRTKRDETYEHLVKTIEGEFDTKVKDELLDRTVTVEQLTDKATRDHADMTMATEFGRLRNRVVTRIADLSGSVAALSEKEDVRAATISDITGSLEDMKKTGRYMSQFIAEAFEQIRKDLRKADELGTDLGMATGILQALNDGAGRAEMSARYTEKLFQNVDLDSVSLHSMFKALDAALAAKGLLIEKSDVRDIRRAVFEAVRANPDSSLAPLVSLGDGVSAADKGTVLLASVINFARNEGFVAEVVRLQMLGAKERAAAVNELRRVFNETNESVLDELVQNVKDRTKATADPAKILVTPQLTERAAQRVLNERDKALKMQADLAEMRRNLAVLRGVLPSIAAVADTAHQRVEIGRAFVVADGANYIDAGSVDAADKDLIEAARKNSLRLTGPDAFTPEKMREIIARNQDWLDARASDPSKQTLVYHSLKRQNFAMQRHMNGAKVRQFSSSIFDQYTRGVSELLLRTGTKGGERAAKAFMQLAGWQRLANGRAEVVGKEYEQLRSTFEKASRVTPRDFVDLFFDPARRILDNYRGEEKEAFAIIDREFMNDPVRAVMWARPGAKAAFFALMKNVVKQNALQMEWSKLAGSDRVADQRLGDLERRRIEKGVEGHTSYRNIHGNVKSWVSAFAHRISKDRVFDLYSGLDLKLALKDGPEEVRAKLAVTFDEAAWTTFLRPLITNPLGGFVGPKDAGGLAAVVTPRMAERALDMSGNDLLAFADAIYKEVGDPEYKDGPREYRERVLMHVKSQWEMLARATHANDVQSARGLTISGFPTLGVDARIADDLPPAWFTYPQYTPEDHRQAAHAIFVSGIFGRNGKQLLASLDEMNLELEARKAELAAENLIGRPDNDPLWQSLKRRDRAKYDRLRQIDEYARQGHDFARIISDLLQMESETFTQIHAIRETLAGMVSAMVSGMTTAIKNTVTPTNLFLVQRSYSPEVWKTVGGSYAKMGRLFLGSLTQLFGVDIFKDNPALQAMVRSGALDSANHLSFVKNLTGERGVDDSLSLYARTLRKMRTVYTQSKLTPVQGGTAPALRLMNPFQYTQVLVNMANTWQLMETYSEMAARASTVYKADPKSTRELTAEDVGMTDKAAFEARKDLLAQNGYTLEELAQTMAKGKNPFDDRLIMAMNNISTTLLANEASPVNRPLIMTRSKKGQAAGIFFGWAIEQTMRVKQVLETQDGRRDLGTIARGGALLAITLLPASLAFGALLDEWDELVERKQNRRRVSDGPEAWPQALTGVGTFGLFAEGVDHFTSLRQGSSPHSDMFSLDNRIVVISSLKNFAQAVRNVATAGPENANYANIVRPLITSVGANGILQNAFILDKMLGNGLQEIPGVGAVIAAEASVAGRKNVYNYIRESGLTVGLQPRMVAGAGAYAVVPLTPHISNMVLAAFADEPEEFQKAFRRAVKVAQESGEPDPVKKVIDNFTARHPYKMLFVGTPTMFEVAKMNESMTERGRAVVSSALRNFDRYAASLGAKPYMGSVRMSDVQMRRAIDQSTPEPGLIESVLRRAASLRSDAGW